MTESLMDDDRIIFEDYPLGLAVIIVDGIECESF